MGMQSSDSIAALLTPLKSAAADGYVKLLQPYKWADSSPAHSARLLQTISSNSSQPASDIVLSTVLERFGPTDEQDEQATTKTL